MAYSFSELREIAQLVSASRWNGTSANADSVLLIFLKGQALGLHPMTALDFIQIIQGKAVLSPQGMLALINRSGFMTAIQVESTETACTVHMQRGQTVHSETFNLEHAKSMGLVGKDNWKKQPSVMLKWRAISACCRVLFPDVIQGFYTIEVISPDTQVDEEGALLIAQPTTPKLQAPVIPEYVAQEGDQRVILVQVQAERDTDGKPFLLCADQDGELFHCPSTALFRNAGYDVTKEWGNGQPRTLTPSATATIRDGAVVSVVKNEG